MKKTNKKGFTLIELLAVIVILALLVAVAIPAVTKYLNTSRKGVFTDDAAAAVSAVRNDVILNGRKNNGKYYINVAGAPQDAEVNGMLEKKLNKSPYGDAYTGYVQVNGTDEYTYSIYLTDGTHCIMSKKDDAAPQDVANEEDIDSSFKTDSTKCTKVTISSGTTGTETK